MRLPIFSMCFEVFMMPAGFLHCESPRRIEKRLQLAENAFGLQKISQDIEKALLAISKPSQAPENVPRLQKTSGAWKSAEILEGGAARGKKPALPPFRLIR